MSISVELQRIIDAKAAIKTAINNKGGSLTNQKIEQYATAITNLPGEGGSAPSVEAQAIFTGATIPLTYRNNTVSYENNYSYKSSTHDITIDGLTGRATITGNGTKDVTVAFAVTSTTSSLKNFTITCVKGTQTIVYRGMHAHYGTDIGTGVLTLAYTHVPKDGSEGAVGTEYIFIQTGSANTNANLPTFSTATTLFNGIHSHQLLNVLIGKRTVSSLPAGFLSLSYSFNQPVILPASITSIGTNFLRESRGFNQPLDISNVTSIGAAFLFGCRTFNQPLDISNVTSIGFSFLSSCGSFNKPLTINSSLTTIGNDFLFGCSSFNHPLDISNVTSIGASFLFGCGSLNKPLTIPSGLTSIGASFLRSCVSFNQPLDISNVTSIGTAFLFGCRSFNQPLTLNSSLTTINSSFLFDCSIFNQPLDISNVTSIGIQFLFSCSSFNQSLILNSSLTTITNSFLINCLAFNQPLDISNVTSIGNDFLDGCDSFNQPLTIPSGLTSVGLDFLLNAFSFSTIIWNPSIYPTDNDALSQRINSKTNASGTGIKVFGTNRAGLITALPNRTANPFRKLVNGGS